MTETIKATKRQRDIKFEHTGAHVALCHKDNPAANLKTTLITKSTSGITDQQAASQLVLIEKAKLNSQIRQELSDAVKKAFEDRDDWLYLEDFDESQVFFWKNEDMYVVKYTLSTDDEYVLDNRATPVEKEWFYKETDGKALVSDEAIDKLEEGEFVLVRKALNNPETNSRVVKALATYTEKKEKMQEEIQKAVAAKDVEIAKLQAEMVSLQEIVKAAEAAKKETLLKSRETAAGEFLKEGAAELVKSTESLDEDAFAAILKALGAQKAAVVESDLMKQVSDPAAPAVAEVKEESRTAQILKAKHQAKA